MVTWGDYGPAEFDRRLMPRGHKPADTGQSALFVAAVEPVKRPAPAAAEQLPGQGELDLFGEGEL